MGLYKNVDMQRQFSARGVVPITSSLYQIWNNCVGQFENLVYTIFGKRKWYLFFLKDMTKIIIISKCNVLF